MSIMAHNPKQNNMISAILTIIGVIILLFIIFIIGILAIIITKVGAIAWFFIGKGCGCLIVIFFVLAFIIGLFA